jgi:hypothetical protein
MFTDSGARKHMERRSKAVWGSGLRLFSVVCLAAATSSCGELTTQGQGSSYLIIEQLQAAPGAEPDKLGGNLLSDVFTVVDDVGGVYNDVGEATFALAMKDPITSPSSANFITVNRYRVRYIRSDGRNTPGVDVPFGFDGALTATVSDQGASGSFEIVRHISKLEPPLMALLTNGVIISTIAEVTFYGRDQTGREVSVVGRISVDFGNFADPQ